MPATDCTNLQPLLHLGGHSFLATTSTSLPLSTGTIVTSPLAVYNIPCNVYFSTMVTGIGHCPDHLTVSVPFSTANSMQSVPWQAAISNLTTANFNHPVFDIPHPTQLNTTVLSDLESTMATLDGELTSTIWNANSQIDSLTTGTATVSTDYIAGVALGLSILCCLGITILIFHSRRNGLSTQDNRNCTNCGRRCAPPEEQRLTLTVHQEHMTVSLFTNLTIVKLRDISEFIKGWDDHGRCCAICKTTHATPTLCFMEDDLNVPEVEILQGLLDIR